MLPALPTLPTPPAAYPLLTVVKLNQLAAAYDTNTFMPDRIKVELDDNMDLALHSLAAHQHYIDQLALIAKQTLAANKAATIKADKGQGDRAAALKVAFNSQKLLVRIAKLAHDDHQAFDGSWNQFRALSVSTTAPKLPAGHQAEFIKAREKIMADGKLINVKVAKMAQYVTQADALTKMNATLVGTGKTPTAQQATADALAAAKQLEAQFLDLMKKSMGSEHRNLGGGKNIGWVSVESKIKILRVNANLATVSAQLSASSQQYFINIQAAVKTYKATIKTMDTLGVTTLRTISPALQKDPTVAGPLAAAKAVRDEALKVSVEAQALLKEAEKLMVRIKKKTA